MADSPAQAPFSILGDDPVDASEDTLEFGTFVQPFAERLMLSVDNTPFTVGVFAKWGQGKTTVMRMLRTRLKDDGCPTVWFEPWKYNTREGVWKGLASTLVREIQQNDTLLREIQRKRGALRDFVARVLASVPFGVKWGDRLVDVLKREPCSPSVLHQFEDQLQGLFDVVGDTGKHKPLVLFVDDLDRCFPEPALAVLEGLKLVLNKPGLIVVMGIAEEEVGRAIEAAYLKQLEGSDRDLGEQWGARYLAKMIQMPFPLPVVSRSSFEEYVGQCLRNSHVNDTLEVPNAQDDGLVAQWRGIIADATDQNLREVKRFINHYIVEWDKAEASAAVSQAGRPSRAYGLSHRRVAFVLLLAWRFPEFFRRIQGASHEHLFTDFQRFFLSDTSDGGSFLESDKAFLDDTELGELFRRCLTPQFGAARPLVSQFAGWSELAPYLQFGSLAHDAAVHAEGMQHVEPPLTKRAPQQSASPPPRGAWTPSSPPKPTAARGKVFAHETAITPPSKAVDSPPEAATRSAAPVHEPDAAPVASEEVQDALARSHKLFGGGQIEEGLKLLARALNKARHAKDKPGQALLYAKMGYLEHERERFDQARTYLDSAVKLAHEVGDPRTEAEARKNLSSGYARQGQLDRAEEEISAALEIYRRIEDPTGIWTSLTALGEHQYRLGGDLSLAARVLEEAREFASQSGNDTGVVETLLVLGAVYHKKGHWNTAAERYGAAQKLAIGVGNTAAEFDAIVGHVEAWASAGRLTDAREMVESAWKIADARESSPERLRRYLRVGDACRAMGEFADAANAYRDAIHIADDQDLDGPIVGMVQYGGATLEPFWVTVPAGGFAMGSNEVQGSAPARSVTVSSFEVSRFPVTNVQYAAFLAANDKREHFVGEDPPQPPIHWPDRHAPDGLENHPVTGVTWDDAMAYCRWLESAAADVGEESSGHRVVRLPSEAQWEYAARGPTGQPYPWGDAVPTPSHANYGGDRDATCHVAAHELGHTPLGIQDMAGNVAEWCLDWMGPYEEGQATDPVGPDEGTERVARGGSYRSSAEQLVAVHRAGFDPSRGHDDVGFRVARLSVEPTEQ